MAENNSNENRSARTPVNRTPSARMITITVTMAAALSLGAAMLFSEREKTPEVSVKTPGTAVTAEVSPDSTESADKPDKTQKSTTKQKNTTTRKSTTSRSTAEAAAVYSFPADINSADLGCLCACPGIGEATAESILAYRESVGRIHDLNELLSVYGIGEGTLGVIRQYFYVAEGDYIPMTTTVRTTTSEAYSTAAEQETTAVTEETEPAEETVLTTTAAEPEATETSQPPERRPVDINTADAEEIAEALLIDMELAERIVEMRENILAFLKPQGLLHVEGMTPALLEELMPYIIVSPSDKIDDHGVIITTTAAEE